jgi:hypothetical protein
MITRQLPLDKRASLEDDLKCLADVGTIAHSFLRHEEHHHACRSSTYAEYLEDD